MNPQSKIPVQPISVKVDSIGSLLTTIRSACAGKTDDPESELDFWDIYESLGVVKTLLEDVSSDLESIEFHGKSKK